MSTPDFKVDLARGHVGERFLLEREVVNPAPEGERRWDLECLDGRTVEVKCDSYHPAKTPNFFMELRTRVHGDESAAGTLLGGPWRALRDGVDVFVYLFHKPGRARSVAYWFPDVGMLVRHLDAHLADYEVRRVRSARLTAVGLLVPRASLAHLCYVTRYEGP